MCSLAENHSDQLETSGLRLLRNHGITMNHRQSEPRDTHVANGFRLSSFFSASAAHPSHHPALVLVIFLP
jgi:hypothetical protein